MLNDIHYNKLCQLISDKDLRENYYQIGTVIYNNHTLCLYMESFKD